MTEVVGAFHRQNLPQLLFHLQRVGALAESQQIGDADTVGITDHRRFVVDVADNQVGSLSADAGQLGQLFDGVGQNSIVVVKQHFGHGDDVPRLGFEQSAGLDHLLHLFQRRIGKILQ